MSLQVGKFTGLLINGIYGFMVLRVDKFTGLLPTRKLANL